MVCTDAAARGLDIPDVRQVVQADFASSAIDYLHRVRPRAASCCLHADTLHCLRRQS